MLQNKNTIMALCRGIKWGFPLLAYSALLLKGSKCKIALTLSDIRMYAMFIQSLLHFIVVRSKYVSGHANKGSPTNGQSGTSLLQTSGMRKPL